MLIMVPFHITAEGNNPGKLPMYVFQGIDQKGCLEGVITGYPSGDHDDPMAYPHGEVPNTMVLGWYVPTTHHAVGGVLVAVVVTEYLLM